MSWSPSGPRVLRGGEMALLERAQIAMPRAELAQHDGADDLVVPIEDPLAAAHEAGVREGHARATAAFESTAIEQRARELAALAARLSSSAEILAANRQALLDELFEDIGTLVFDLVREVVGVELSLASEPARDAVLRALRVAPAHTELIVRLHPSSALAAWELESITPGRRLRVVEDESVEVTGCILEVGSTTIDAQIGPTLERLRETLKHLGAHSHDEDET